jgi:putative membrane-bound dehydrogenase-like protein
VKNLLLRENLEDLPVKGHIRVHRFLIIIGLTLASASGLMAQKEHGFDNSKPSGQPYLEPAESLRRMRVPEGFEVKLFAAEPDIINPISFTVDERGRLWVVECYEYPKRTPKGKKPRDRIKILEDTTGSGRADKVTVWAEGKDLPIGWDLATGIEVGHGGVFLGAAPYLFFLRDTQGAGHCTDQQVLLQGFGSQDTHETLNTMQWGPDGLLYGLHGIFTHSKVGGVQLNAAVWRYDVRAKHFDIFAEGTSNPWGLDFDAHGQAFLCACVIPHAFHIIPGGTYIRQAGGSFNPYAYGLLREISDHLHHQESGWAHAGLLVLQGDHIPAEYRGSMLMGSIHGCAIKRDLLQRRASTFVARHGPDFLVSGDKNFRPINMRWGPDGSIYLIDWHDQNPCHQASPDSWDMTHGRIFKIQRKPASGGRQPRVESPGNLADRSSRDLVELLTNNSAWWHRTALRLLSERHDRSVAPALEDLAFRSQDDTHSLRGLWGLYVVGAFDDAIARKALDHPSPWMRSWAVRLLGEPRHMSASMLAALMKLATSEPAPEVRLQLACTAQGLSRQDTLPLLHNLMSHREDAHDPDIPLMIWLAYEPRVTGQRAACLGWLREHAAANPLVTDEIVPRTMRRLVATGKAGDLSACVAFLGAATDKAVQRRALEGLVLGLQNRQVNPPPEWPPVFAALLRTGDGEVQRLARHLAVSLRDVEAIRQSVALALDAGQPAGKRVEAIRDLALARPPEALRALEQLLARELNLDLRCEACRALAGYDSPEIPPRVLAGWKSYPPGLRGEAVNLLAGRKEWARALLAAAGSKQVPPTDITNNTILRIHAFRDQRLNAQIEAAWGRVRDTPAAELDALINQMRTHLHEGRASPERGRKVFENQCAKCHKFEGKGHDVGPALDGAARDIEYLLINVLDPNRVVGQPYFTRFVTLKNGRVETGLLAAEDEQSVTLKNENDAVKVIERKDIEEITVQPKSLMPEGLSKNMTLQDFRDLVRYVMANPFLTDVAVAGPWAADAAITIAPEHPQQAPVSWARPVVGPPGRIPLPPSKGGKGSVAYVAADIEAPAATNTRLQLGAGNLLKAWLNGQVVYQGQPGNGPAAPDQAAVDVCLCQGVNHLLFRITYAGDHQALYARLLDPQRKLKYPGK